MKDFTSAKNRIIKMLENANIKLSSVFSNVFGVTAWTMVCKLVAGETNMEKLLEYIQSILQDAPSKSCLVLHTDSFFTLRELFTRAAHGQLRSR